MHTCCMPRGWGRVCMGWAAWASACWTDVCSAAAALGAANPGGDASVMMACITAHLSAHILSISLEGAFIPGRPYRVCIGVIMISHYHAAVERPTKMNFRSQGFYSNSFCALTLHRHIVRSQPG